MVVAMALADWDRSGGNRQTDRDLGDDEWPWKEAHLRQTFLAGSVLGVCLTPGRGGLVKGLGISRTLLASPALTSTACLAGTSGVTWKMTPQTQRPIASPISRC